MSTCTFFGHKDCTDSISEKLYKEIESLILNNDVTKFYVGNQGNFDALAYKLLVKLRVKYPNIKIYRVLAYMPKSGEVIPDSIIPEGIELVYPRYAILWRNKWMIDNSDYAIAYVTSNIGVAFKFASMAEEKGKNVRNIFNH
ncbi:MAG: hypothetical protein J1E85_01350 [Ruminococcus sp.]|nr:hypothetical protein [Ruminococcus sp.]